MRRLLFLLLLPLILAIPRAGHAQIAANCNSISGNVGCIGAITDGTTTVDNVQTIILNGGFVTNEGNGKAQLTVTGAGTTFTPNAQGVQVTIPVPWSTQLHQNQGVCQGHQPAWEDCINNFTADEMILQTQDPSVLFEVGFGGGFTNGDQTGLQLTLNGVMYPEYTTYTTGESNAALAQDLAARINGGLYGGSVVSGGTGIVNGQKYALNVPVGIGAAYTCVVVPIIQAIASGGALTGFTVVGTGGSNIQGGVCPQQLPNPVGLVGVNATIAPTQGDYAFVAALEANIDANGVGGQPTANVVGTVVNFDFPWGASNSVKACAGVTTNLAPGVSCPGSPTGTLAGVSGTGQALDVNPNVIHGRYVPGRHPKPRDEIDLWDSAGQSGPNTDLNTGYGARVVEVGPSWEATATASSAAGVRTISVDALNAPSLSNGWFVYDKNNPAGVADGTYILSGGGTTTITLNQPLVNQGVVSSDTLGFVNEAAPCGENTLYAANSTSALNFAGTLLEVSGCPADSNGYDVEVSKNNNSNVLFGIHSVYSGSLYAGWQVSTGTAFSACSGQLFDNTGAPTFTEICGTPVLSMTYDLTKVSNGGTFNWGNSNTGGSTWMSLNNADMTLGAGVGLVAPGLATAGTIGGAVCATAAGVLLYESGSNCEAGGGVTSLGGQSGAITLAGLTMAGSALTSRNLDVQVFTSTGANTWTKPAFCSVVTNCVTEVQVIAGGPGGGGGPQGTLGAAGLSGGASGGGGSCLRTVFLTSNLTSTVTVTVGAGGAGGGGGTSGVGSSGSPGAVTTFGSYLEAWTGGSGQAGQVSATSQGGASGGTSASGTAGASGGAGSFITGTVGGTGASQSSANAFGAHNTGGAGASVTASSSGSGADCVAGSGAGGTLTAASAGIQSGYGASAPGTTFVTGVNAASSGTATAGGNAIGNASLFPSTSGAAGGGANTAGTGGAGGGAATGAYGCGGAGGGAGTVAGGAGGTGCQGYAVAVTTGG